MANQPESMATTEAFKKRYGSLVRPIPSSSKLQQMMDFKAAEKVGDEFCWPVSLALPHGHTWNGGANYGGGINLNDAQAGTIKMAKAKGCEYYNRSEIPQGVITKGQTSSQAVMAPVMDIYMSRLIEATSHGLEMMSFYGGLNIGVISVKGANTGAVFTATISEADWAAGLFKCSENMPIDIYDPGTNGAPGSNKRTNAGAAVVNVVNAATRQVTITLANVSDYAGITVNDVIVPFNAKDNWANGLDYISTVSAAGTNTSLLGINPSQFGLWRAATFSAGNGPMNITKFLQATTQLSINASDSPGFDEGKDREPYVFVCSPFTQIDMIVEQAALRRYTEESEIKKMRAGGSGLILDTPVGPVKIVSSSYCKAGHAFFLRPSDWHYCGSAEPEFFAPAGASPITAHPDRNTYRVMRYFDLAPMADVLNGTLKVTGIDNASLS